MKKILVLLLLVVYVFEKPAAQTQTPGLDVLGYGYDVFGNYADQKSKKRYCLFKFNNFSETPIGSYRYSVPQYVFLENISNHMIKRIQGSSIRDYAKSLSASVGLGVDAMLFSASVSSSFDTSKSGTEQRFYYTYMDANTKWRISFDERDQAYLKTILDSRFIQDLATMEPRKLFELYGTHYIARAYLGGRADFTSESVIKSETNTQEISVAIEAKYSAVTANASLDTKKSETLSNSQTTSKLTVVGGNSQYANNINNPETYRLWADGIEGMPVLCDFDAESLKPIWDFCTAPARKAQLQAEFEKMCAEHPLPEAFANLGAVKNKAVMIKNMATGLFFDFPGFNPTNSKQGDLLTTYTYDNNTKANQGFDRIYMMEAVDTDPQFVFIHPQHTRYVLDVKGGNLTIGAPIQILSSNKSASQMFKLQPVDGEANTYYIKVKNDLCLEVRPNSTSVVLGQFKSSNNQKWRFEDFNPQDIAQPEAGAYAIQCFEGGQFWDFPGAYPAVRENKLQLWSPGNAIGDRTMKLYKIGDSYLIKPNHHPQNLLTATKKDGQLTNEKATKADNQQFKFEYGGQPLAYNIVNKGTGQLITANGNQTNQNGCPVTSWNRYGGLNQSWRLFGPSAGQTPIHEGTYYVKCEQSNKYWDIAGNDPENNKDGARAQIWDLDGGRDRKVKFEPCDDDIEYYRIKFDNGRYLDVSGPWEWSATEKALEKVGKAPTRKKDKGAKLQCYQYIKNDAQKFKIVYLGNNTFSILSKINGRAVDVSGKKINDNGPDLQLWDWDQNNPGQRFVFVNISNNQIYKYE